MKIPSSNLGRTCCVQKLFLAFRTIFVHNMFSPCSELGIFKYWTWKSMNNMSSYCGLVDAKTRASDKNLPVQLELGVQICPHVVGHLILDPIGWLICLFKISRLPRNQHFKKFLRCLKLFYLFSKYKHTTKNKCNNLLWDSCP